MRRKFGGVLLLLSILVSIGAGAADAKPMKETDKFPKKLTNAGFHPQIGIWYTVWWDDEKPYSDHWQDWTRYRPVLGDYASDDPDIIRAHMQWIKQAGIDYVILDDTNSHFADGGNLANNIEAIFDVVESMPEGTAPKLAFAIGAGQYAGNSVEAHMKEVDLIFEQYANRPSYYYWKGKPLLVDYTTPDWFYKWDDERFTVRWATGSTGDAASVAPDTGLWGWVFNEYVPNKEVFGVMPGWGTAHQGRPTTPIDREDGKLYTDLWTEAVKRNPEMIVIASFNDHAEEIGIEAITPRSADVKPWVDAYGTPTPDWYEQITKGYASLRQGFMEDFYYKPENGKQIYRYHNGRMVEQSAAPRGKPVIVVPEAYFTGKFLKDETKKPNKNVAVDVFQTWVDDFKGIKKSWGYETLLENGNTVQGMSNGAEFYDIKKSGLDPMFTQIVDPKQRIVRKGFKAHPAWLDSKGWSLGKVAVKLPKAKKLYLTYYPGKVNTLSDGIVSSVIVNGRTTDTQWVTGEAGWKSKVVIDLSKYAGQSIELAFKVGWGQEKLGDEATTAYDAFLIGDPLIVTKL